MSVELVDLGLRRGLARYRSDRLGLLAELGDQRTDLAVSGVGGLRLYVVTAAALAHEVLMTRGADYQKSRGLRKFARPLLGDGLLTAEGDRHRRHRKLLAGGFQSRQISRYADDMVALTGAMLASWQAGEARDFAHEITMLTVRIAAKTMFGDSDVPADEVGAALDVANRWVMDRASSLLPIPLGFPTPSNVAMTRALGRLDEIVYDVIARKRARGGEGDILSTLLAAQDEDDGTALTDREVRDEVMTFFMAGHETTATALSWMFHALALHPEVHARVVAELDRVLDGRPPVHDDLDRLPYLRQVLQETFRVYPPVYMIGRHALVDTTIAGHAVPAGSYVLINVLGLNRRADYFPDPDRFDPERFAGGESSAPRGGYIPFGTGPRVCIGNQFATMEAMLLAATIFQRAVPAATGAEVTAEPLITLRPAPGLPFQVTWRR